MWKLRWRNRDGGERLMLSFSYNIESLLYLSNFHQPMWKGVEKLYVEVKVEE